MPHGLHIRDDRAATLARRLAKRKGTTMTRAVIEALEGALQREDRPLVERIAEIARDAERMGDRAHGRVMSKAEIDELWGHDPGRDLGHDRDDK
ncbi:MAG TPA: type II toxin-antitoxin system VapB family antitoxin [Candidatus Acidoferrales bacterium]